MRLEITILLCIYNSFIISLIFPILLPFFSVGLFYAIICLGIFVIGRFLFRFLVWVASQPIIPGFHIWSADRERRLKAEREERELNRKVKGVRREGIKKVRWAWEEEEEKEPVSLEDKDGDEGEVEDEEERTYSDESEGEMGYVDGTGYIGSKEEERYARY